MALPLIGKNRTIIGALLFVLLSLPLFASTPVISLNSFEGKVTRVRDGDDIVVRDAAERRHLVRLWGIDAPELSQPYGKEAKKHLEKLILSKTVRVQKKTVDKYKRTIGIVTRTNDKIEINLRLLQDGYAWWYQKYAEKKKDYEAAQHKARQERKGLWRNAQSQQPTPPWEWRKEKPIKRSYSFRRELGKKCPGEKEDCRSYNRSVRESSMTYKFFVFSTQRDCQTALQAVRESCM